MPQDVIPKQRAFVVGYSAAVDRLLDCIDALAALKDEWDAMGYAAGSPPVGGTDFTLTDTAVQLVLPAATAEMFNAAVGAVEEVRSTVADNTGYLNPIRP